MANKYTNVYVGKAGFLDYGAKDMDARNVAIESINYPSLAKKTKIHGYENYCAIEQNGRVLGREEKHSMASWVKEIETLAPNIKASFFGLGSYKNVTITGVNSRGTKQTVNTSAKSSNGITCYFNATVSVYLGPIDIKKFRSWMAEWGHKFGLKKKGNVWISKTEWQNFIMKMLVPFCVDSSVKTMDAPKTNPTFNMTKTNAKIVYDEVEKMMKNYLLNNLGLQVSVYFDSPLN
ncbi:MAG: hypothetical protein IJC87_00850 [Clostridia bacterium]|nr:hypothetical protein [Clostridia bacterium]